LNRINLPFKKAVLIGFFCIPGSVMGTGIPVIDGASVTISIQKIVADVKSWARDEVLQRAGMETDIKISEDRSASDENIAANTIVRITGAIADAHNQVMDAQATPSFMACKNISVARAKRTAKDASFQASYDSMRGYWNSELTPPGTSRAAYVSSVNAEIANKMDAINDELSGTGKEQAFSRADIFLRTGQYAGDLVYTPAEQRASEVFIDLLIGPYSERARLLLGTKSLDELTDNERVELGQATVRKGALRSVLESLRSDFIGDEDGNSTALARQDFIVNSRFANDEWHKKMTCTGQSGGPANCATDSIVLKELAVMMGQELELANEILTQRKLSNLLLSLITANEAP
jgi:hypothetical protein